MMQEERRREDGQQDIEDSLLMNQTRAFFCEGVCACVFVCVCSRARVLVCVCVCVCV